MNDWLRRKSKELIISTILAPTRFYADYFEIAYDHVATTFRQDGLVDAGGVANETCALAEAKKIRATLSENAAHGFLKKNAFRLALVNRRGWLRSNERSAKFVGGPRLAGSPKPTADQRRGFSDAL